jgi:hypothetical protein|tara:strand:- start:322 stop:498 length:177 start_codon:yes stop_codon:yes gene_type:complete
MMEESFKKLFGLKYSPLLGFCSLCMSIFDKITCLPIALACSTGLLLPSNLDGCIRATE